MESGRILTEVGAVVPADRRAALESAYRRLVDGPLPDGLLHTRLLRAEGGHWRIQTLWRDRAALDAMRAQPEPPAAPRLFREAGAEPTLTVLEVVAER
ncbi:hypothetical protein TR51_21830 [Kitasatospora griseola]|uniref:ABM domain-containing protein n=1 Tax=Kitasatospora griseola TaxID=2064 RepID=A0A0D0PN11_KITGR|nr:MULTISPECIES: antibiotic biosynthesis monooxygenase [Kitasatospora]KIQ61882.1 hypothetical protein TR51_21830 [Kitasatospora griseola]